MAIQQSFRDFGGCWGVPVPLDEDQQQECVYILILSLFGKLFGHVNLQETLEKN